MKLWKLHISGWDIHLLVLPSYACTLYRYDRLLQKCHEAEYENGNGICTTETVDRLFQSIELAILIEIIRRRISFYLQLTPRFSLTEKRGNLQSFLNTLIFARRKLNPLHNQCSPSSQCRCRSDIKAGKILSLIGIKAIIAKGKNIFR